MELNEKTGELFMRQCGRCSHFDFEQFSAGGFYCDTFPDGIPSPLLLAKKDHTKLYPGDKGIMFKEKSDD
ncbi:MAG TPA: hypothetical protein PK158_10660 [Spirochaetota bacterium]|nr:hypothetical protein [Spirochaetota bacterium]